jgi:hypothetical protein
VRFDRTVTDAGLRYHGAEINPPLTVRVYNPRDGAGRIDIPWTGGDVGDLEQRLAWARAGRPAARPGVNACA